MWNWVETSQPAISIMQRSGAGLSNVTFNMKGIFVSFEKMRCTENIAQAMTGILADQMNASGKTWRDYMSWVNLYMQYLKLCLIGESALHELVTVNSWIPVDFLFKKGDTADFEAWYTQDKNLLEMFYTDSQYYLQYVLEKYYVMISMTDDFEALLEREDLHQRTIRGVVLQDEFYADPDDTTKPGLNAANEYAGEPAVGVSVRLVGKNDDREYAATVTGEDGSYELTYVEEAAVGEPLKLVIAENCEYGLFAENETDVWRDVELEFRSEWNSQATRTTNFSTETNLSWTFDYCDQLFLQPEDQYNHDLARLSLGMAVAGYSAPEADRYWNSDGDMGRESNIRAAYEKLGFIDSPYPTRFVHYDKNLNDDSSKVAFSIAAKDIFNPEISIKEDEAQKEHLVVVVLRGGGYGCEWSNNFYVKQADVQNYHAGFYFAASEVAK